MPVLSAALGIAPSPHLTLEALWETWLPPTTRSKSVKSLLSRGHVWPGSTTLCGHARLSER